MGLSFLSAEEQNGTHDRNTQNNNKRILLEVSQNLTTTSECRRIVFKLNILSRHSPHILVHSTSGLRPSE